MVTDKISTSFRSRNWRSDDGNWQWSTPPRREEMFICLWTGDATNRKTVRTAQPTALFGDSYAK
jgi:hypothetical protein